MLVTTISSRNQLMFSYTRAEIEDSGQDCTQSHNKMRGNSNKIITDSLARVHACHTALIRQLPDLALFAIVPGSVGQHRLRSVLWCAVVCLPAIVELIDTCVTIEPYFFFFFSRLNCHLSVYICRQVPKETWILLFQGCLLISVSTSLGPPHKAGGPPVIPMVRRGLRTRQPFPPS